MSNAKALRHMAAWWRSFAETSGDAETRKERLAWAAYLEELADKDRPGGKTELPAGTA